MADFICDFCSSPQVSFNWPAKTFLVAPGAASREDWAACAQCHALLLAGDYEGLARRTADTFNYNHPAFTKEGVYRSALIMHRSFRENRIGDPVPWQRGPEEPKGITLTCVDCRKDRPVTATARQIAAWRLGGTIQDVMSDVPEEEREMFLTGLCPDCWNRIFK